MRTAQRLALFAFVAIACFPTTLIAQVTATPVIGGFTVHCTDASGSVVYTNFVNQLSDSAMSTIEPPGTPVILINYPVASHFPQLLQLFLYAHECGHHVSGDIIMGVIFHEVNPDREKRADRIGIRLLRDQFHISQSQADAIASAFQNNPPIPGYLPGPERAQWISDCYATNNDDCSKPTPQTEPNPTPQPNPDELSCTIDSTSVPWNPPGTVQVRIDGNDVGSFDFGPSGSSSLDFSCKAGHHYFRFSVSGAIPAECSGSFDVDEDNTDFSPKINVSPFGQVTCSLH